MLGEGPALGTKQWELSLFLSKGSQRSHRSERALGDDALASVACLPGEELTFEGCRVYGAIWKHRTDSAHYVSVLLSSTSLTPALGI